MSLSTRNPEINRKKFEKFLKSKITSVSTYLSNMNSIQTWLIENEICKEDFNIYRDIELIPYIKDELENNKKKSWKAYNNRKNIRGHLNDSWEYWVKFNNDTLDLGLNTIFYGPAGTGKTLKLNDYKKRFFTDSSNIRYKFIVYQQGYKYEDFVGSVFYESCLEALKLVGYATFEECYNDDYKDRSKKFGEAQIDSSKQFAFFIDQISEGNLSTVFGNLITLLDEDKRTGAEDELWIDLPFSKEKFCVPANLYVLGAMNIDRSPLVFADCTANRVFEYRGVYPLYIEGEWWTSLLEALNQAIYNWKRNNDILIGHGFFIGKPETDRLKILNNNIIPLLYKYCLNNQGTVKRILTEAAVLVKQIGVKGSFRLIAE
jgi:hypothetical protein